MAGRDVLHVDMDAFYASVEQRDDPALVGKPLVVGGDTRGVVAAASYEARRFGIRSAMPMTEARRHCPGLVRVAPRMARYREVSGQIFAVFREFTPLVEGLSLDEAFLDVTASRRLFGDAPAIARAVKAAILDRTALTASVGVAGNKLVAKIASDMDKPDGLVVITPENQAARLDPLPAAVIPGIGPETRRKLDAAGIHTVGELRDAPDPALERIFGRYAGRIRQRAAGVDDRPVAPQRDEKSISAEQTFDTDIVDRGELHRRLAALSERTAARLRKAGRTAATLRVKIRSADFRTFTRQCGLVPATSNTDRIIAAARSVLDSWLDENPGAAIRLLGVGGAALAEDGQQDLFAATAGDGADTVDRAVDEIRDRFGTASLARARSLDRR